MQAQWSDAALMTLHVDSMFSHDTQARMLRINEPDGEPAPRLFLGRTAERNVLRLRHDLPSELVATLIECCDAEPTLQSESERPRCAARVIELLERHAMVEHVWRGPAYRLHIPLRHVWHDTAEIVAIDATNIDLMHSFPDWIDELSARFRQPCFVAVEGGRATALCCSVRITAAAHAAGVETLPEYRGRGLARQVVRAWAERVQALGAVPMYSTSFANHASRAVAKALGAQQFGVDFHVT